MVWDASAGSVRASYWRTTVDEDGHYCFAAASDSPHRTLMRRNNADARKGLMRLPVQTLVPRALRPRSIHLVCEPAQFERLCRAGSVLTTGSCRTGQSLGSLARLEDFAGSSDMDDLLVVWLSPPATGSPPECQDDPPAHNQDDWSTACAMQ